MRFRKISRLILENNASDLITGDVIKIVKSVFRTLFYTDDVAERNDIGMNSNDKKASYTLISNLEEFGDDTIALSDLYAVMRILSHYKNTQLRGYDHIAELVRDLIKDRVKEIKSPDRKIVVDYNNAQYGKVLISFPDEIAPRSLLLKQINKVIEGVLESKNIPKEYDNYGNFKYPVFKYFSKNKNTLGDRQFYCKPELIDPIVSTVFPNVPVEKIGQPEEKTTKEAEVVDPNVIKFLETVKTPYGDRHAIRLSSDFNKSRVVWNDAKEKKLTPKYINYDFDSKRIMISGKDSDYSKLKAFFDGHGLSTSELDNLYDLSKIETKIESEENDQTQGLIFTNLPKNSMGIAYIRNGNSDASKEFLKQLIQYVFYDYKWDSVNYRYIVDGDFSQYSLFRDILERFKYDENVKQLESLIKEKVSTKNLIKTPKEGELDKKMESDIDNNLDTLYPNSRFELYDLQKEGVKFLLSRKYAILGSETGAGKTIQLIYAADLATKKSDDPILIITLKATQMQWVQEIVDVLGEQERNKISTDPMDIRKWTVLYYENFSAGKLLQERMYNLKKGNFGLMILDELHKVKHEKSNRSANIADVSANIPIKWGASATVSANKPLDVKNQLKMLDHPLGHIPDGKFKKNFAGMILKDISIKKSREPISDDGEEEGVGFDDSYGSRGKAYVDGPLEMRLEAAENLHRWLSLMGVYIRHSKKDMREARGEKMPDLKIDTVSTPINKDVLKQLMDKKLSSYVDDDLEISKLIAFRESIAKLKVPKTVSETLEIIQNNQKDKAHNYAKSKVLIFTSFVESGQLLHALLTLHLQQINPKWKAHTYLSSTPKHEIKNIKKIMEDKDSKVLVMSLKMGGTGISFPNTFGNMIINDYDWTPESIEQSEGRIYRINTVQDVNIKYVLAEGTDENLYEKVQMKKQIAEIIQTYRKDYLDSIGGKELLTKIVGLQKQLGSLDSDIKNLEAGAIGSTLTESFSNFFNQFNLIKNTLDS